MPVSHDADRINGRTEVLRTPQHDDGLSHYFRPREFPLTFCGRISPDRTFSEALLNGDRLLTCPECKRIALYFSIQEHTARTQYPPGSTP